MGTLVRLQLVMTDSPTDLPLYALQRIADRWLVWTPDADPQTPAVRLVAVLDAAEPSAIFGYHKNP
jgi:hypothetical protein